MAPEPPWTVEAHSGNVHTIRFRDISPGWSQRIMLSGDRHHDNLHADHRMELNHLEKAREYNAPIIDIGDFFCLMQGKYDPRKSYTDMRPELTTGPYLDRVIDTAETFYEPYADLFAVIGQGNHEASVLKHNETDMTRRIANRLQRASSEPDRAFAGGYGGWVVLRFRWHKTKRQTLRLKYHHGHGGGGPVTKGVIQTNRRAVFLPDADIIVTGHIHEAWSVPITRERINAAGTTGTDYQYHVSVPTYKNDYGNGSGGFHIEKGRPPKPMGCAWLVLEKMPGINGRIVPRIELDLVIPK
jgi:hypothetical protein